MTVVKKIRNYFSGRQTENAEIVTQLVQLLSIYKSSVVGGPTTNQLIGWRERLFSVREQPSSAIQIVGAKYT